MSPTAILSVLDAGPGAPSTGDVRELGPSHVWPDDVGRTYVEQRHPIQHEQHDWVRWFVLRSAL